MPVNLKIHNITPMKHLTLLLLAGSLLTILLSPIFSSLPHSHPPAVTSASPIVTAEIKNSFYLLGQPITGKLAQKITKIVTTATGGGIVISVRTGLGHSSYDAYVVGPGVGEYVVGLDSDLSVIYILPA